MEGIQFELQSFKDYNPRQVTVSFNQWINLLHSTAMLHRCGQTTLLYIKMKFTQSKRLKVWKTCAGILSNQIFIQRQLELAGAHVANPNTSNSSTTVTLATLQRLQINMWLHTTQYKRGKKYLKAVISPASQ